MLRRLLHRGKTRRVCLRNRHGRGSCQYRTCGAAPHPGRARIHTRRTDLQQINISRLVTRLATPICSPCNHTALVYRAGRGGLRVSACSGSPCIPPPQPVNVQASTKITPWQASVPPSPVQLRAAAAATGWNQPADGATCTVALLAAQRRSFERASGTPKSSVFCPESAAVSPPVCCPRLSLKGSPFEAKPDSNQDMIDQLKQTNTK